jgi:hypothetical protein
VPKTPSIKYPREDMTTPRRLVQLWCKKHRTTVKDFASLVGINYERLLRYLNYNSVIPLPIAYKITRIVSGTDKVENVFPPDECGVDQKVTE